MAASRNDKSASESVDSSCSADGRLAGQTARAPLLVGVPVHDVLFILLILAVFGLLALCAKGVEKL
jgi:hypothetical protein